MVKVAVQVAMALIREHENVVLMPQELRVAETFMKDLREKVAKQNGKKNAAGVNVVNAQRAVEQIQHQQRGGALSLHMTLQNPSPECLSK